MYRMMYPGYDYFSFSPWVGIVSIILQVLFWIIIFKLLFSLFHSFSGHHNHGQTDTEGDTNLEIIKSRYAKGEITKREYEEMKKELS